jgi:hypothetical protein
LRPGVGPGQKPGILDDISKKGAFSPLRRLFLPPKKQF